MKSLKEKNPGEREAYRKVTEALARRRGGATVADICAATALPLARARELLPRAADEFSGRLEVTESGEIRYSFPHGFTSRYRGFGVRLRRFGWKLLSGLGIAGSFAFKVWIMVMLIGYFLLFMAIALASVCLSVAANSRESNGRRGGGLYFGPGIFNLIWRLWFYSELTRSLDNRYYGGRRSERKSPPSRPLHRAIFSFIFGEEDPNRDWSAREKKTVIAYVQSHQGVISLPEFMALTGRNSTEAEDTIMAFCAEFNGSPEATGEGTIVYRFDELLLRVDKQDRSFTSPSPRDDRDLSPPVRRLRQFSANSKTMNVWFGIINTVNLLFGSYFLYNALQTGAILVQEQFNAAPYLYKMTWWLSLNFVQNPLPFIGVGLGLVPLVFSALFWLIPALRLWFEKKENENTRMSNLRRLGFGRIWARPLAVETKDIESRIPECRPKNMAAAQDRVIKEMGAWSLPEVELNEQGEAVYSFKELEREKEALEKYRLGIPDAKSDMGKTVFEA
jgi:hypothetical protein